MFASTVTPNLSTAPIGSLMSHSFLPISAPLHQLTNKNIFCREANMGEKGGGVFFKECEGQPPCSAFQAFVIPGNLFPVNILSQ